MKNLKLSIIFIITVVISASCTENPKSDQAEVSDAREISNVENATTLAIDKENSEVSWVGTRPGKRHNGTIGIKEGNLKAANNNLVGGTILLDMHEINVLDIEGEDRQKLTGHLQSPDFFDSDKHPEAKFEITSVEELDASGTSVSTEQQDSEFQLSNPTHRISGNLTIRDKTLGISFPARVNSTERELLAEAKFNIDRTKWGVSYQDEAKAADKAKDKFIYNTVNVGFNIVALK